MNTSSTSVISSMPSMNFRTETTTSGLSVMMMTASSAKVEFSDAFADPITARLDHLRVQGRGGQDPNTLVHVVREGGRGGEVACARTAVLETLTTSTSPARSGSRAGASCPR